MGKGKDKKSVATAAKVDASASSSTKEKSGGGLIIYVLVAVIAALVPTAMWLSKGAVTNTKSTVNTQDMSSKVPVGANVEGKPREVIGCKDRHQQCAGFAKNNACVDTPGWMAVNCPVSCNSCHLRDPKVRCDRSKLNMDQNPIYQPGDMESMFRRLSDGNLPENAKYDIKVWSTSPWVVTFENFLSEKEVNALIKTVKKWERSTDVGSTNEIGETGRVLSRGRTSSNSWCDADCEAHPDVKSVTKRIASITGVPAANYESFQVLRYELGQKYDVHHDYGHDDRYLACGPRILTFFLYLSDVEEGGETSFPTLNITVKPKKGRALLWPSTLNDDPEIQDGRTLHSAMPVIKGRKFAANAWLHLYNYREPNKWGCTGTFDELDE